MINEKKINLIIKSNGKKSKSTQVNPSTPQSWTQDQNNSIERKGKKSMKINSP